MGKYPQTEKTKFVTITNGYDPEDFSDFSRSMRNDKFTISYIGTFYIERTPAYFLRAVRELIDEHKLSCHGLEIRFIGDCRYVRGEAVDEIVGREGLSTVDNLFFDPCLNPLR